MPTPVAFLIIIILQHLTLLGLCVFLISEVEFKFMTIERLWCLTTLTTSIFLVCSYNLDTKETQRTSRIFYLIGILNLSVMAPIEPISDSFEFDGDVLHFHSFL